MNTSIRNKNKNKEKQKGFTRSVRLADATLSRASGTSASSTAGFTLIETLVAISIFVASVTVLLVVTGGGIKDVNSAQNKLTATYLAKEGVELIRAARDTYFMEETTRQNTLYGVGSPSITPPTMGRLMQFCNTKAGIQESDDPDEPAIETEPYKFCHALDTVTYPGTTPWLYQPDLIQTSTDLTHVAGPLGPCNRVVGNGISDVLLAGSQQGCNINLALETRVCRVKMDLKRYEIIGDSPVDPTMEEAREGIATETCAEYFYNEGVIRPKWTVAYNADDEPIYPSNDAGSFTGFSRQIFVDPEYAGGDSDGGMRVTVRVYWIEGNRLLRVRVDDFLTGWPSTTVITP